MSEMVNGSTIDFQPRIALPSSKAPYRAKKEKKKREKKREKNTSRALLFPGSPARSVAVGDSFSPRGEKERGDITLFFF
ncbi:hypothetical protein BHM03_00002858 [Ensete ventricosum]|uniref:Uncharacterized protein n=1 Tax=Ensete ventricosum TaxID=4639 RepID=A0A445M9U9_ENSVE|nr:hypothetical protein BHM03_00002858 [Ensete ventricosum]